MMPFTTALVILHHIWFFLTTTQKSKLIIMILSLPFENAFTLHNVRIYNKSVFNKDQNQYYYNRFWEKCSYKSAKKISVTDLFDSRTTLRFGKIKVAKEEFYGAKKTTNIWNVSVINTVTSKLVGIQNSSKYLIRHLDHVIETLIFILPKMSGYVMKFKEKGGDKNRNNNLMSLRIVGEKLLENYKTICTRIVDLENIELNTLTVYNDRYIKIKTRTYEDNIYNDFCGLKELQDCVEG